jgi:multicomponent Na+:H+ antiporter subunit E
VTLAILAIALALIWIAATGSLTLPNLVLGAALSLAALWLVRDLREHRHVVRRAISILGLARLFLYELLLSAIKVALLVLSPSMRKRLKPAIVAFPLTVKSDVGITLLANMITLTPGTLSVDVSADRSVLFVHAISVPDKSVLVAGIANGFERKVMEVFK